MDYQGIPPSPLFQAYNSVVFSIFTDICHYNHYLIPEHSYHPQKKPHIKQESFPFPSAPGNSKSTFCLYGFACSGGFL